MNTKYFLVFLFFILSSSQAQVHKVGLDGLKINSVAISERGYPNGFVIAGSDSNGVFFHNLDEPDSVWVNHYFYNRCVTSVYVQDAYSRASSRIFVGLEPISNDSSLIYDTFHPVQSYWSTIDYGLNRGEIEQIVSITGFEESEKDFPLPVFCCAGNRNIYVLENEIWEKSWTGYESTVINTLYSNDSTILGGGSIQGKTSSLLFVKSENNGKEWIDFQPEIGTSYICYSIAGPRYLPGIIYAGLNKAVIKSTDGGETWAFTSLRDINDVFFTSIQVNPANYSQVFAGGKNIKNEFILYKSENSGENWVQILPYENNVKGITSIVPTVVDGVVILYIGTDGSGIYKYNSGVTSVKNDETIGTAEFLLYQNYPNPFNPFTKIKYSVPDRVYVTLRIYDILGREITTLVNDEKQAGTYEVEFSEDSVLGKLASGIYYYQLKAGDFQKTKKLILLK